MSGIMSMVLGAKTAIAAAVDAYFNLVTLLLPGDGTNGAQNNTFLDSSTNNFSITRNGNTTQGTFSPFSQTGWSNFFNTGYLTVASNAAFDLGSGDATIETWIYPTSSGQTCGIFDKRSSGANYSQFPQIALSSGAIVVLVSYNGSSWAVTINGATPAANAWTHIALVRSGNTWTLYVNGSSSGTPVTAAGSVYSSTDSLCIGVSTSTGTNPFAGYISNARIVKGTAVYTSAFTPPTAALTAITNTSLLTCQSNRFVDNSTNAFSITPNSTYSVQPFSPFAPTAAYSAATNGGSGYFDGTGDNLTVPTNSANSVGSGSFYFEAWVYLTNPSVAQMIIADPSNTGGLFVGLNIDGGSRFTIGRTAVAVDNLVTVTWIGNQWYHLAVNRNGTSLQFFVNGTQVGSTGTNSVNYPSVGYRVGAEQSAGSSPLTGYISGLRLVKSSVNTTNFTPPTAPPDASTAALCLQFTNAGITDATAKNDLETVGNAQISTTQSKFGGSSMLFDGTGDYLLFPSSPNLAFGTGDYTVEAWVYFTSISGAALQVIFRSGAGGNNFYFHVDSDQISVGTGSAFISNQATTFNTNTWYHIAACRSGTTLRLFRDGTQVGSSVTDSTNWVSTGTAGVGSNETGIQTVFGYIDDLRVSRYARYTTNFTPPTAAFPLQ